MTDPSQWSSDQQFCRSFGHQWKPRTATMITGRLGILMNYDVSQFCACCTAIRTALIDRDGWLIGGWKISYPEGYLIKGQGRLTRQDRADVRLYSVMGAARVPEVVGHG